MPCSFAISEYAALFSGEMVEYMGVMLVWEGYREVEGCVLWSRYKVGDENKVGNGMRPTGGRGLLNPLAPGYGCYVSVLSSLALIAVSIIYVASQKKIYRSKSVFF